MRWGKGGEFWGKGKEGREWREKKEGRRGEGGGKGGRVVVGEGGVGEGR